jgi:hypothetical protein
MGRACNTNAERKNAYGTLVEKPEGKRPLARTRRMWVDNIKIPALSSGDPGFRYLPDYQFSGLCPWFNSFSQEIAGRVPLIRRRLYIIFKFFIQLPPYHSTLHDVRLLQHC